MTVGIYPYELLLFLEFDRCQVTQPDDTVAVIPYNQFFQVRYCFDPAVSHRKVQSPVIGKQPIGFNKIGSPQNIDDRLRVQSQLQHFHWVRLDHELLGFPSPYKYIGDPFHLRETRPGKEHRHIAHLNLPVFFTFKRITNHGVNVLAHGLYHQVCGRREYVFDLVDPRFKLHAGYIDIGVPFKEGLDRAASAIGRTAHRSYAVNPLDSNFKRPGHRDQHLIDRLFAIISNDPDFREYDIREQQGLHLPVSKTAKY